MRTLGALLILGLFIVGCQKPTETVVTEKIKLPKGTKIEAVTLKELTSGGTPEGEAVPMMVSQDVKDSSGHVLVPRGAAVTGEVSWSRTEGSLGGLTNRPARLKFRFKEVVLPDGTRAKLSASEEKEDQEFELNRDNTGQINVTSQVEQLADNPQNQEAMDALKRLVEDGDMSNLNSEKLSEVAQQLNLTATTRLANDKDVNQVADLMQKIKGGSTIASLASGGSLLAVDAAMELIGVVGQVGSRLGRSLGGRNIRAYVGTPVTAYVVQDVQVTP